MRKLLFNYSFYSHPEIGKLQGVTSNPITPHHKNSSSNCEVEEEEEEKKAIACALQDLLFAPWLDLDIEKKEASASLYCIRRRNHILARSRSREEGSK
jgi:hypothetical protein